MEATTIPGLLKRWNAVSDIVFSHGSEVCVQGRGRSPKVSMHVQEAMSCREAVICQHGSD